MEKNYKGQMMIRSLDELSVEQRKKARAASIGIGSLVLLIEVLGFLCFGSLPRMDNSLLFYCIDWLLLIATPVVSYAVGASFGLDLMLSDLGFVISFGSYSGSEASSLNQPFSSHDSHRVYHSSNYGSHVSINPSSGRPMSGSSGMDISGNPYGSRSW